MSLINFGILKHLLWFTIPLFNSNQPLSYQNKSRVSPDYFQNPAHLSTQNSLKMIKIFSSIKNEFKHFFERTPPLILQPVSPFLRSRRGSLKEVFEFVFWLSRIFLPFSGSLCGKMCKISENHLGSPHFYFGNLKADLNWKVGW